MTLSHRKINRTQPSHFGKSKQERPDCKLHTTSSDRFAPMALSPTVRLKLLTLELRRLREERGKTIEEIAERVGISKSALSRIENGLVGVKIPVLRSLLHEYEVPDGRQADLFALAHETRQRGWWQTAGGDLPSREWRTLVGLEQEAASVNAFAGMVITGLLQTRDYAHAVLRSHRRKAPAEELKALVDLRMRRQHRVGQLDLWVILTEEVLLRPVGGPAVMREQLNHLLASAEHPRTVIQVLPVHAGEHVGLRGPFTVLGFEPPVELQAVYFEGNRWEACIEDAAGVEPYRRDFELLRAKSLDPDESLRLISRLNERNPT
jgi:transcriptional regulator with XRE-family HTH domain